jgi:enhancing lycopene biosynthesis protein 2
MTKPRIGVVLSGCGVFDGSEIHEAVLTLLALDEARAEAMCFAPDVEFEEIDHLTKRPTGQRRNALREAARIARGNIRDVAKAKARDLDALIFPGGFGAAKNLCTFAEKGADCTVLPEVERLILEMFEAKKPIGFLCIAPALGAKVLGKVGGAQLTIGNDPATAKGIEAMGSKHVKCDCHSIVIDSAKRVVSTPAYMLGPGVADVNAGVSKLVREILAQCSVPAA